MIRVVHNKQFDSAIICQGGTMEGYIKVPLRGIPKTIPRKTSPLLGAGQDGESPTSLAGPLQITFGFIVYSFIKVFQPPLLPIHPLLPPQLTTLPQLSGTFTEI